MLVDGLCGFVNDLGKLVQHVCCPALAVLGEIADFPGRLVAQRGGSILQLADDLVGDSVALGTGSASVIAVASGDEAG
jgi:hypothetical protein